MNPPLLSIITPVFNSKEFIHLCIQNVVQQNCSSLEHIIVDGGSTDGTVEIIRDLAKEYSHIRWISEKDKGQSDAMNKGIELANGSVIGFLNADDYYEPEVLNRVCELFQTLPKNSFAVANCRIWQTEDSFHLNEPKDLRFISLVKKKSVHPYNPVAYFYHKALHKKAGLYDINDHYSMDIDFILRVVRKAHCYYFNEIWGNMRFLPGSKTFEDNQQGQAIKRLKDVLKKHWDLAPFWIKWKYNITPYIHKLTGNLFHERE
ncbi:glycosyltransferase family 2 protein [Cytophagaceae bacterium DM2B3-1]|uniref:Glycosyltransferase family 2 protein n=1 Tax=Xanthocytophaga flava TaxID=3048013 RepID=A0ABT7CDX0_9BACT|nr:glycosyltransferase family 2 protein [Xanthocytophaga flavus]MDJ1471647.1 glycosyltransferase family 2 protein [Xanthocytophaga flavus]MDJ1491706.1 glycosyltransferase family 2 protein [Xanthocytophaga flavus]